MAQKKNLTNIFYSISGPSAPEIFWISSQIPDIHHIYGKYATPHACNMKEE